MTGHSLINYELRNGIIAKDLTQYNIGVAALRATPVSDEIIWPK